VDSTCSADPNSGTSSAAPWKSLGKVNSTTFRAGDTINFKRGSVWTANLQVKNSGTSASPITYQAYGSGSALQIKNPGVQWGHSIDITGDYNVVQDFLLSATALSLCTLAVGGGNGQETLTPQSPPRLPNMTHRCTGFPSIDI
jgi:hypothetical protein